MLNPGAFRGDQGSGPEKPARSAGGARHGQDKQTGTDDFGGPGHAVAELPRGLRSLPAGTPLHARPGTEMARQARPRADRGAGPRRAHPARGLSTYPLQHQTRHPEAPAKRASKDDRPMPWAPPLDGRPRKPALADLRLTRSPSRL